MLEKVYKNDLEVATKLIRDGFSSAKISLEQILRTPIAMESIDYDRYALKGLTLNARERMHFLKTELRGELVGSCYLVFTDEEARKINEACLPEHIIFTKSQEAELMRMEFLMEIQNVMASAVVAQFADTLDIYAYGDIPVLKVVQSRLLDPYLEWEADNFNTLLYHKALFYVPELAISPYFLWMSEPIVRRQKPSIYVSNLPYTLENFKREEFLEASPKSSYAKALPTNNEESKYKIGVLDQQNQNMYQSLIEKTKMSVSK